MNKSKKKKPPIIVLAERLEQAWEWDERRSLIHPSSPKKGDRKREDDYYGEAELREQIISLTPDNLQEALIYAVAWRTKLEEIGRQLAKDLDGAIGAIGLLVALANKEGILLNPGMKAYCNLSPGCHAKD